MSGHAPGDAASLLREARRRAGISQRRLALRASTSQDAVSRIERGAETPGVERLRRLLLAAGEELRLESVRASSAPGPPGAREMSPAERLRESASWNLAATRLELAGAAARAAGHRATRRSRDDRG